MPVRCIIILTLFSFARVSAQSGWIRTVNSIELHGSYENNGLIYTLGSGAERTKPNHSGLVLLTTNLKGADNGTIELSLPKSVEDVLPSYPWSIEPVNIHGACLFQIKNALYVLVNTNLFSKEMRTYMIRISGTEISGFRTYRNHSLSSPKSIVQMGDTLLFFAEDESDHQRALFVFHHDSLERNFTMPLAAVRLFVGAVTDSCYLYDFTHLGHVYPANRDLEFDFGRSYSTNIDEFELYDPMIRELQSGRKQLILSDAFFKPSENPQLNFPITTTNFKPSVRLFEEQAGNWTEVHSAYDQLIDANLLLKRLDARDDYQLNYVSHPNTDALTVIARTGNGTEASGLYVWQFDSALRLQHVSDITSRVLDAGVGKRDRFHIRGAISTSDGGLILSCGELINEQEDTMYQLVHLDNLMCLTPQCRDMGCTDPLAWNYDATASIPDGSCWYPQCDSGMIELHLSSPSTFNRENFTNRTRNVAELKLRITGLNDHQTYLNNELADLCKHVALSTEKATIFSQLDRYVCVPDNQCYRIDLINDIPVQSGEERAIYYRLNYNQDIFAQVITGNGELTSKTIYLTDGAFSMMPCVGDEWAYLNPEDVLVYPNPSNGLFSVSLPFSPSPEWTMDVISMEGKVISSASFNQLTNDVDLRVLSSGLYYLWFENQQNPKEQYHRMIRVW
ncbi:MAG: T9SS type A sorting domain-containing protein [Flavobacteriales bacterium]|nr:T9SS type A sorting domain-containing protein [Flavobacteriales bacterium]